MKYRYVYEKYSEVKGADAIAKEHLVAVLQRSSDFLIDTESGTYYDSETNSWKEITE